LKVKVLAEYLRDRLHRLDMEQVLSDKAEQAEQAAVDMEQAQKERQLKDHKALQEHQTLKDNSKDKEKESLGANSSSLRKALHLL
jgi:hypothetical protein